MSKAPLLAGQGLSKTFLHPAEFTIFSQIDIEILQGESVAIVGASGEGKSSLLHILGFLDTPSSGLVFLQGAPVTGAKARAVARNRSLGFVFQSYHLLDELTVLENVLLPLRIARLIANGRSAAYKRALLLLEMMGMEHRWNFLAKKLSGGEKQRVAIARALINEPLCLLADEPSGSLDSQNATAIHDLLFALVKERSIALLMVTHNSELSDRCDRRLVLQGGRLLRS